MVRPDPLRLQVFLARAGVASRRGSEELIREGRVSVNGEMVLEMGVKVVPGRDRVEVDGQRVEIVDTEWVVLHKPKGYVTTREDPEGRPTVYDLLPPECHHLFHVGRLDRMSEGLLLLTNDGETANHLLHPRYGITKEYLADVLGEPTASAIDRLIQGVKLEDGSARAVEAEVLHPLGKGKSRVRLVLEEGRKREVRRMLKAVGHPVKRLVRTRFGPLRLEGLAVGHWRSLTSPEIQELRSAAPTDTSP